jgi:hypothetical protein
MSRRNKRRDFQEGATISLIEKGSSGLKSWSGYIAEAYNQQLYWPAAYPVYSRIRRSMSEMVMVRQALSTWARNVSVDISLPDNPSDDDKKYKDFIFSVFDEVEGGFGRLIDTIVNNVPFYGWGWFSVVPARRDPSWIPPNKGDDWRSESDDGLIGLRRFAWRDPSSFFRWEMNDNKRVLGMHQQDPPLPPVYLDNASSLHLTFGDPNNPEGLSPLEAVWRIERIKHALEVIQGIGFEHAAGYLNITKTESGTISDDDKTNVHAAARAILSAQEGNYALWPFGIQGEVKDINFAAAGNLLEVIKYQGVLALSCFTMQWMALSATTGAGSFAAMQDSSNMGVFTFNAMLDGFASQLDAQVGKRLYEWNKMSFKGLTKRPKIVFTHIEKEAQLSELSQFISSMNGFMPMGEKDWKAIRKRVNFLPKDIPEMEDKPTNQQPPEQPLPPPGGDGQELTPEEIAQQAQDVVEQAMMNVYHGVK